MSTLHLGPGLIAAAVDMNKVEGRSYGRVSGLLERLFGIAVSRAGMARSLARLAKRGERSYGAQKTQLRVGPVADPGETGWKIGGRNASLHEAPDGASTIVYTIEAGRRYSERRRNCWARTAPGPLPSDGWAPYRKFERSSGQVCLGHLLRRCHAMLETARRGSARLPGAFKATLKRTSVVRGFRDS
jgi:hypothetical protein